jgi:hypothetical protein
MVDPGGESTSDPPPSSAVLADDLGKQGAAPTAPGRTALFVLGLALVALCVAGLVIAFTNGNETKTTSPQALTSSTSTTRTAGTATTTTATTTTGRGVSKMTSKSTPSEGVLLALLGTGAVIALAGALYTRLSAIKLPGGAELSLTPQETEHIAANVAEKASPEAAPRDVAAATATALQFAQASKTIAKGTLDEQIIEDAASVGLTRTGAAEAGLQPGSAAEPPTRTLNVVLAPGSAAHRATNPPTPRRVSREPSPSLAAGFTPQPEWNLTASGGKTIRDLVFVNRYVGAAESWSQADIENIDKALGAAMSDAGLQTVIAQYYDGPVTSRMLPSARHVVDVPGTVYKDTVEHIATTLHGERALGGEDPASSVINIMLPEGAVLSDDFSPGHKPSASAAEHSRRRAGTIRLDDGDAASSLQGLGGYHGSVHLTDGTTIYYAVGVYSKENNGIDAFGVPWRNVVATFYHELNETRTDPDVEGVNATGNGALLGWYSQRGQGEIGDLPINACEGNLNLVFQEVLLTDGSATVPIQLMWSNLADGPATKA